MLYAKEISIRVPTDTYNEFILVCDYLHKIKRLNCCYDLSSPFQYLIKVFNAEFKLYSKKHWLKTIENHTSKIKKDYQICFSMPDYHYYPFVDNCKALKTGRSKAIRSFMVKLIEETQIE